MHLTKLEDDYISFDKEKFIEQYELFKNNSIFYYLELIEVFSDVDLFKKPVIGFVLYEIEFQNNEFEILRSWDFIPNKDNFIWENELLNNNILWSELYKILFEVELKIIFTTSNKILKIQSDYYKNNPEDINYLNFNFENIFRNFNVSNSFFVYYDNYSFEDYKLNLLFDIIQEKNIDLDLILKEKGWGEFYKCFNPKVVLEIFSFIKKLIEIPDDQILNINNLKLNEDTILELRKANENI